MTTLASGSKSELEISTIRAISWRLIPFLVLAYFLSYLDRVNVSYASLEMTRHLHFSNLVFGTGSGIFFLGYLLLEIPGAILVERWSARKWIARIMISWGVFATLPADPVLKPTLGKTVETYFRLSQPLVDFLNEPLLRGLEKRKKPLFGLY